MFEPTSPLRVPFACFTAIGLGVYVLFAAFVLEWYPLLGVAVLCLVAAALPVLSLTRRRR